MLAADPTHTQDVACRGDDFAALQELIETALGGALTDPGF